MITVSLSLALCTIMIRRFMDSFSHRIPIAIQSSAAPNTTALFMLSGALYYLYSHLKKGTLVRIGQGHPRHVTYNSSHSRLPIQRRSKNNSWFLRNARACRKKCTDAMYKIAKQSYESLHNLNPCLLLPNKSFQICFTKVRSNTNIGESKQDKKRNVCNVIYSNEAFKKDSNQEVTSSEAKNCGLQTSSQPTITGETVVRKRSKRGILKRLSEGPKSKDDLNVAQKKGKIIKRMTRSGRVYSHFE